MIIYISILKNYDRLSCVNFLYLYFVRKWCCQTADQGGRGCKIHTIYMKMEALHKVLPLSSTTFWLSSAPAQWDEWRATALLLFKEKF